MSYPALLVAFVLAGSALLPPAAQLLCALLAIIGLGVPHGALDGELARTALRPRFGAGWFLVFSGPYLALSALVLLAWHVAPLATLAAFLAASVWHFGSEDAQRGPLIEKLVRGGLPIAVPTLVHPSATAAIFATTTGQPLAAPPAWLTLAAIGWIVLVAAWIGRALLDRRLNALRGPTLLLAVFLMLPPLTAFAIYFVCVHAPAHLASIVADAGRAPRVQDTRAAWSHALPLAGLTLLIGAALWPIYAGPAPARLLALTLQGLAALTLPHMMFDVWLSRRDGSTRIVAADDRMPTAVATS